MHGIRGYVSGIRAPRGTRTNGACLPSGSRPETALRSDPGATTTVTASGGHRTSGCPLTILRTAAPIVAGIAVAPVVLAAGEVALTGAALMALLAGLDPIVFGVIPASKNRPRAGDPAAWYVIAQWNWPDARADLARALASGQD